MSELRTIADWLRRHPPAVAFTGAGISTESGIPDFRSPAGVWARYRPVYFQEFLARAEARREYWRQKAESQADIERAEPNAGHLVLARWEAAGLLRAVITQNIDGLHQRAGSREVHELHGTAREVACLDCGARRGAAAVVARFREDGRVPGCPECGGRLKHATVSFGQTLPAEVLRASWRLAEEAGLLFAIGSSLVVEPAASLPRLAKAAGARLVILNRDSTPLDPMADLVLRGPIGATLQGIDRELGA